MKIGLLQSGECHVPEHLLDRHAGMRQTTVPAYSLVVHHPQAGSILIDTGHSSRFDSVTKKFPGKIYRWITRLQTGSHLPVVTQLEGHPPNHIVLTHLHADHIAGLSDFPSCPIWGSRDLLSDVHQWTKTGFSSLSKGFLPELLPPDFIQRFRPLIPSPLTWEYRHYFPVGTDLFGDGKITVLPLPGHSTGHCGVMLRGTTAGPVLYISDAVWNIKAITEQMQPSRTAMWLNRASLYNQTLQTLKNILHDFPDIILLPAHCEISAARFRRKLDLNKTR